MRKYSSKSAYQVIRDYAAHGDEHMAARIYTESSIAYPRYIAALNEGRKAKAARGEA